MGLPYKTEDYDEVGGGSGSASTVNDLGGMNFSTLENNELMKRVDANNVGGSDLYTFASSAGNVDTNIIYSLVNSNALGLIVLEKDNNTNNYVIDIRPNPITNNSLRIKENGTEAKVGINVFDPEEALDIEGNLQLRSGAQGKIFFKHPSGLQKVELDGDQDGTNGGKFIIKTKVDNGSMTQKLEINNDGAIGLGASPDYGVAGNFLMSLGSGSLPEWFVPTPRIITSVKKTSSQSFASGGLIKITGWDTPHVDLGTTGWSNVNSRYTIQRTATYRIYLKAIISNELNEQEALRYLNVGIYIYNSGGGAPVFQDLDTTTLVNVDNTAGRVERGSGDYSIIRTLNATQYIEFQVGSLQGDIGNFNVESAVVNIEEVGASYVAGVGQFFTLTAGNALQTKVNNLNNYAQHISQWGDVRVGNSITAFHNNNTVDQWLPLYNQPADGSLQQLFQPITLNDATRPVKIEACVNMLYIETTIGMRVVCNNGITTSVVPGTTTWRQSTGNTGDIDTAPYITSIVHVPNGNASVTYSIEGYVRSNTPSANPFFFINTIIMPPGNVTQSTLLLMEL